MANRNQIPANPPVTFDTSDPVFQRIVAEAVAARLAIEKAAMAEKHAAKPAKADKADKYIAWTISAFKKAGFDDVQPRQNVFTFNLWLAKGYRPKEGEKAISVKGLRLFHISQVRPLAADDAKMIAAKAAKGVPVAGLVKPAKGKSKIVPIHEQA